MKRVKNKMVKLKKLFLAPVLLGGTASIDSQKLEEIVAGNLGPNYSSSAEQFSQQQNGYFDYMAAIDFLMKNDFDNRSNVRLSNSRNGKSTYLHEIKALVTEYARVIDLVKQGNRKQVYADPLFIETRDDIQIQKIGVNTFHIPRLLFYDAYQNFSSGNSAKGTQSFIDILTFGERMAGSGGTRNYIRGTSLESIAFNEAENLLPRMSQNDLKNLERICSDILKYNSLGGMLQARLPHQLKLIGRIISEGYMGVQMEGNVVDEVTAKTISEQIAKLNPAQKQALNETAGRALFNHVNSYLDMLARPEKEWKAIGSPDIYFPSFGNLATLFDLVDSPVPTVLHTAIEQRTRYRLLLLHSKVEQYRWEHNELPISLDELKDSKAIFDPLTGEKFKYKHEKGRLGYELYSNGLNNTEFQTGKIFLAPKRGDNIARRT